jgi:hypothetical protein
MRLRYLLAYHTTNIYLLDYMEYLVWEKMIVCTPIPSIYTFVKLKFTSMQTGDFVYTSIKDV